MSIFVMLHFLDFKCALSMRRSLDVSAGLRIVDSCASCHEESRDKIGANMEKLTKKGLFMLLGVGR